VYTGQLALSLSGEFLRMKEVCHLTTGIPLPPTHNRGTVPIDAVFGTVGLMVTSVALLPSRTGVGDHRVFLIDVSSDSILGDVFPRVIPAAGRLLNCESDKIKNNYIKVLTQLSNRHLIFKKLLVVDRESIGISSSRVQLEMNRIDQDPSSTATSTRGRTSNGLHMQVCGYTDDGFWYGWSGISLEKHEIRGTCFESADGGE